MANVTAGYNWTSGETVTPAKLNSAAAPTVVVADNEVTTAKIADGNVTTAKIADSNVTAAKLASSAVETAKIADGAVTNAKVADGAVVKVLQASNATRQAVTGIIPIDNTVPLVTEGDEILSQAITPTTATNKVLVRAVVPFTASAAYNVTFSLFRGSTCIAATTVAPTTSDYGQVATIEFFDSPASASSQTYSVRAGANAAATTSVCGYHSLGTTLFNGTYYRTLTLTEIKAS